MPCRRKEGRKDRAKSQSVPPLCGRATTVSVSYMSPLLNGLLEGLREDLDVGGSLHFRVPVGGNFEADLQCQKPKVRIHGRSNQIGPGP